MGTWPCKHQANHARLIEIDGAPERFNTAIQLFSCSIACACAAVFLGGGWRESLFASIAGGLIFLWEKLLKRIAPNEFALEITASFLTAMFAVLVSNWIVDFHDRIATLGSLIILVPGFSFTLAFSEISNRHLSSGVARLAGAMVAFLMLVCGVALAWRLCGEWHLPSSSSPGISEWAYMLAAIISPIALAVVFQARMNDWLVISVVAWAGLAVATFLGPLKGVEFGAFSGAFVIGFLANAFARFVDRPALIPQMPATLMLVPGSLGYRSLTAFLENQGIEGMESAFITTMVAASIVSGLLAANLIMPPRRFL
ncbi:MAG: threonine/serine exporter family protein [Pirellulaceae bacterium]